MKELLLIGALLCLSPALAYSKDLEFVAHDSYGAVAKNCSEWNENKDPIYDAMIASSVLGNVTGLENMCQSLKPKDPFYCIDSSISKPSLISQSVKLLCKKHPDIKISDATFAVWSIFGRKAHNKS